MRIVNWIKHLWHGCTWSYVMDADEGYYISECSCCKTLRRFIYLSAIERLTKQDTDRIIGKISQQLMERSPWLDLVKKQDSLVGQDKCQVVNKES